MTKPHCFHQIEVSAFLCCEVRFETFHGFCECFSSVSFCSPQIHGFSMVWWRVLPVDGFSPTFIEMNSYNLKERVRNREICVYLHCSGFGTFRRASIRLQWIHMYLEQLSIMECWFCLQCTCFALLHHRSPSQFHTQSLVILLWWSMWDCLASIFIGV